jgi:hypothetical protein
VKRYFAALTLAVFGFPATALAMPVEPPGPGSPITSRVPDVPPRLPAIGTDVAAPDQQSSPRSPSPAPTSGASDFDWTDAGLGAAVATSLLALSLVGGITLRRRQQRSSALAG